MIEKDHFIDIASRHGHYASWAIWSDVGEKPKSNIGDMSIFDLNQNPQILEQLNPNIIMVGLNFSRAVDKAQFVNFHDKSSQAHDFKIRYAFRDTKYYGAYMTDIIKNFEQLDSEKVISYLKLNPDFEAHNIALFKQELKDLKTDNPLIIAFGNRTYNILLKYFKNEYAIVKIPHYSKYISKENYKLEIAKTLIW